MAFRDDRLGMTEEQWTLFQSRTNGFSEQNDLGVDLSLLRENLRLTPLQRLQQHERALALVQELRRAGARTRRA